MSLAVELTAAAEALKGRCPVLGIPALLDDADASTFAAALPDPLVAPDALALALSGVDVWLSAGAIRDHRAGTCPCVIEGG